MSSARVTVTLPPEVVSAMDREQPNRSRFVLQAVTRELDRLRIEQLEQSLLHPHPDSLEVAESGFGLWVDGLGDDASDLVAPGAGEELRWTTDHGWVGKEP